MTGTVLRTSDKGFGFLCVDGYENDIFFHERDFLGEFTNIKRGDKVSLSRIEENTNGKGQCARNVKLA